MIDSRAPGFPKVEPLRRRLALHLRQLIARGLPGGTKYLGGCARTGPGARRTRRHQAPAPAYDERVRGSPFAEPSNGWSEFILGTIEVRAIPGDHLDAIDVDNIRTIARRLRALLAGSPLQPT